MREKLTDLFKRQNNIIKVLLIFAGLFAALYLQKFSFNVKYLPMVFYALFIWLLVFLLLYKILNVFAGDRLTLFIGVFSASMLTGLWLVSPNWLINDAIGVIILVYLAACGPKISLKYSIILGIAAVIYDFIAVYLLDIMSSTAATAMAKNLPLLLTIPKTLSIEETRLTYAIGMGDFMIPFFIIKAEWLLAKKHSRPKICRLPITVLMLAIGYLVGLAVTFVVLFLMKQGQPALVYIIPIMLITLIVTYCKIGLIKIKTS